MMATAAPVVALEADRPTVLAQVFRPPQNQQADPNTLTEEEKKRRDGRRGGAGGQGGQGGMGGMSGQGGSDGARRSRDGGGMGGMSGQGGSDGARRNRDGGGMGGMSGQGGSDGARRNRDGGGMGGMSGQGGSDGARRNRDGGGMGGMSGQGGSDGARRSRDSGGMGGMSGQNGMDGSRRNRGEDRTPPPVTTPPAPKVQQQAPAAPPVQQTAPVTPKVEPPVGTAPKVQTPPIINQKPPSAPATVSPDIRGDRNRDGERMRSRDRDTRDAVPSGGTSTPQAAPSSGQRQMAPATPATGESRNDSRQRGDGDGERNRDRPFKFQRRDGTNEAGRDAGPQTDQRDARRERNDEPRGHFKWRERRNDAERRRDRQERFEMQRKEGFGNLDALRQRRTERSLDGGRKVLEEPDSRRIIRSEGRSFITRDETRRFRRFDRDASVRRRPDGRNVTTVERPNGIRIISETAPDGRLIRRYRRTRDGREIMLIDNRRTWRKWGAIGAGAAIAGLIVAIDPPRYRGPRERYIIDYDRASDDDIYDALIAPPIDRLDRGYTLDEVLGTYNLRERMRRIDLDSINFEFGSWEVGEGQYEKLERAARAMGRIIDRNPDEVFLIEGHTDAVGDDTDNLSLSDRRAEEVANILTEEFDIPPENLATQGYGEQFLKIDTDGPERANRRVTLRRITPLLERRTSRRHDRY